MAGKATQNEEAFEQKFLEGLLEKHPRFVAALTVLADLYTRQGHYAKGLQLDQRLARLCPQDSMVFYNLACSYSLLKQVKKALTAVQWAVRCGYTEYAFLEQDDDLVHLRADPAFQAYWKGIYQKNSA